MDTVAELSVEAVGVEKREKQLEVFFLPIVRRGGHQQEVARLSAQLQELKSMVGSQQQVLVYLGQELEAQQMPVSSAAAQAAPPAKKARVVRAKSSSKAPSALRTSSCEPSLNL